MTIIVFLIDTSASMNVRCYLGGRPTLLDVAKGAVETFVKARQRSPESRGDRYMLLSFEEPPQNIKAGWKENLATFMNELKNLKSDGLTTMGRALKNTFDLLNINRMQSGIDTYGQGWCPFFLEPTMIVVITDGGKLTSPSGVQEDFNLPMHAPIPGSELTREPFRWDQRLFSLVLRLPGTPMLEQNIGLVPSDSSPIDAMCEVTGGRSYCVTSHRIMNQCIDSLIQKVQSGVVINFEKIGPDPLPPEVKGDSESQSDKDNEWVSSQENGTARPGIQASTSLSTSLSAWHNCRKLIYVSRSAQKGFPGGFWPIPEDFWPDLNSSSLPPRSAQPNVKFTCTGQEPLVIENLPFDKYELEPSPLTQYILARKQPTVCWQVFVANSYKNSEVGHPFGYLKASTNLTCVNLFVMPYNYPVLLPLLDELFKLHRLKPTNEWRIQFRNYLQTLPPYYAGPLKRALIRMGCPGSLAQSLIPDALENSLSFSVMNYLKVLKNQAKSEFDRICNEVSNKIAAKNKRMQGSVRIVSRLPLRKELVSHPLLQDKFTSLREQLNEFGGFTVGIPQSTRAQQVYLNPGDIPPSQLVEQCNLLRERFFHPNSHICSDNDSQHNLPVNQMGNYQEYLKRMPMPLREVESTPVRRHMFGNPFKIDKRMMVDEADMDLVTGGSGAVRGTKRLATTIEPSPRQSSKRRPGPLPKDMVAQRPSTPGLVSPVPEKSDAKSFIKGKNLETEDDQPGSSLKKSFDSMSPKMFAGNEQVDDVDFTNDNVMNIKTEPVDEEESAYLGNSWGETCRNTPEEATDSGFGGQNEPFVNGYLISGKTDVNYPSVNVICPKSEGEQSNLSSVKVEVVEESQEVGTEGEGPTESSNVRSKIKDENKERVLAEIKGNEATAEQEVKESAVDIKVFNMKIRSRASMEVRKPGKRHGPLLEQLKLLKGSIDTRLRVVEDIISEVLRFKRFFLASLLRDFASTKEFLSANTNGTGVAVEVAPAVDGPT